ncbi:hypothetical protein KSP39_PZI005736 [Platanthera zijinensis]|uniref:Reverse transcriptase n=1 Tax=Platanthera zijinensis TaxID=2320716 RepID=A0AAP0BSH3_9ASPA
MEDAVLANDLQELPFVGANHKWCNNQPGAALVLEIMHKFKVSTARSGFMAIKIDRAQAYDKMLQGHSIDISLSPAGPRISHLFYVDDILLVGDASLTALGAIWSTLEDYYKWMGQCINSSKSIVVFSKATTSWKADWIARSLGFRRVTEMLYLGVKFAMRKLRGADFSDLLIRIQSKVPSGEEERGGHICGE